MNLFQAYLLTTILPNLNNALSTAMFCSGFGVVGALIILAISDGEYKKAGVWAKDLMWVFILFLFISIFVPNTKQVALIFGLKIVTSEQAIQLYGTAGQYIQHWLEEELKDEVQNTGDTPAKH